MTIPEREGVTEREWMSDREWMCVYERGEWIYMRRRISEKMNDYTWERRSNWERMNEWQRMNVCEWERGINIYEKENKWKNEWLYLREKE